MATASGPPVYLDNNATTRPADEVVEAMLPYLRERWGNPSSIHTFGSRVGRAVDDARERIARHLGASGPGEIVFTSGGTESDNAAIRGALALGAREGKRHVVTTAVEHPAVRSLLRGLESPEAPDRVEVTWLPVTGGGDIRYGVGGLRAAIRPDTALVSVMWANNETGVVFPIAEIAAACEEAGALLHVDAVQAAGKVPIDLERLPGIDLLALSGHKLHGPKGIGILFVRRGFHLPALVAGGHQERGRRAGTENVPGIAGLAAAFDLCARSLAEDARRTARLRDDLERRVLDAVPGAVRNGAADRRLPGTSSLRFPDQDGEALVLDLARRGISTSSGSACTSGSLEPSHVLLAMGVRPRDALGSLRLSLSRETTEEEVSLAAEAVVASVRRLRGLAAAPGARTRMVLE